MTQTAFLFALLACSSVSEAPPRGGGTHELDPARACDWSACGTVSDAEGAPVKGAWLEVIRSDGVKDERSVLDETGQWLLHIREENAGPPPWKLKIGAPGHVEQTIDLPNPLPEVGVRTETKLVAK